MIGGKRFLKRKFGIKYTTTRRRCRAFTNCDECFICVAIITMEYQITNNVY